MPPAQPAPAQQLPDRAAETWATLAASRTFLENGQVNQAARLLDTPGREPTESTCTQSQFAAMSTLGEVCLRRGKLHLAAATYQFLLDWVDTQPQDRELVRFYDGLAALYYEWNLLEKASHYLQWSLEMIEHSGLPAEWSTDSYVRLAGVRWAQGDANGADAAMRRALLTASHSADEVVVRQVAAAQARLWLRQGRVAAAQHWADRCGLTPADKVRYPRQFEYLTLARVLIASGQAAQTLPLLQQLRRAATNDGRGGDLVEILAVRASAFQTLGDTQRAWTELAQALCCAEREEYVRTFVDEGAPMVELLQQTAAKGVTLIYVKNLLATFATIPHTAPMPAATLPDPWLPSSPLVEPLTQREHEVLVLVAAGQANDDIAQALTISITTVKKHLSNIMGKLGAKNRTEAVAKARSLAIF